MSHHVLGFEEIDRTMVAVVGGKGAHLGALARMEGVQVPPGFCVTTAAFRRSVAEAPGIDARLERLSRLAPDDREAIRTLSAEIREILDEIDLPEDLAAEITERIGAQAAWAVRSSATAEDLPTASFAGQQDSFLNVIGASAVLQHVRRCWASLFTERAVAYRLRGGFDHRKVHMAVVVQRMVAPQASGVLFTADPVTGNRRVTSVEAVFGLGEALVSGRVDADVYTVRGGEVVARTVATKALAIHAAPQGGTQTQAVPAERQQQPALTDAQVVQLAALGRRIEAHLGGPQDIEWCLAEGGLRIVQSRPITTLFPIPDADDDEPHVYVSVGHGQMMTDAMKPLGLSLFKLSAGRPMFDAGGRLFVDVTRGLAAPASRAGLLAVFGRSDPPLRDALETVLARGDFIPSLPDAGPAGPPPGGPPAPFEPDPALVEVLIKDSQDSIAALKDAIRTRSGVALLDFIRDDIPELKRILAEPRSHRLIMAGMEAAWWLNEKLEAWLGEKNAADVLTWSVPHNVTSEMGLALLDVADVIRQHPEVVAALQRVEGEGFLDELEALEGGRASRDAIEAWLDRYGMRCVGEIDITRPRWRERPSTLVPLILSNVRNAEPGAGGRRFEEGRRAALQRAQALLERLRTLPDGAQKAAETQRMIDRVRALIGYREYPKYGMICRYFVYRQALLEEAARLVEAGVIGEAEDIFYLSFEELHDVVRAQRADASLVRRRKEAFRLYQMLTPPRVLTSEGEALSGAYRREDVPDGALVGLAVSAGTVEGRARVIRDLAQADLDAGDILVTPFTDPSWTPLFVSIRGLVTEVGGQMTHGAVIAREYGLPAVVGVANATRLIRDGQRIRVHGTEGYVELLG
ncbi:MAG: phosphoenolpyruvate synthase [Alphaproteobacteria bacterium]|nr:phosphoenolpyruvate synthase [Alphaproteobacteria bacterium]